MAQTMRYDDDALLTPANLISLARMVLAGPFVLAMLEWKDSWLNLGLWVILSVSDGVDGWLARRQGPTKSGAFLDQLADKVLTVSAFWALVSIGTFSMLPVLLITVREVGIALYRTAVGTTKGVSLPAQWPGKLKTALQTMVIGWALAPPLADEEGVLQFLLWAAVALTWYSGLLILGARWTSLHRTAP
ncbi:MAG: CDP-alcohol phosphatidyltransferase family protein [Acidimicrobiia bacterium]|jgi:CDP-diacylglycerol--glycerol-3-phosphate 3-phosphatidyltransferase|nr:CDP-alcohol phosphatidyltransferase family protein [Acidimicrobiia bacterium]MBP8179417.1 CDP-alcohol phosphatidyltransferase family protein [Acidimicrobiia bacterium]